MLPWTVYINCAWGPNVINGIEWPTKSRCDGQ